MKIRLIRVAKGGAKWADSAAENWVKRFRSKWSFEEIKLKPAPDNGNVENRRKRESEKLLGRIATHERLIVLDERGKLYRTEEFSEMISDSMNSSVKSLVFAIGGPFGHSEIIRSRAWRVLSLSKMVLNHELARLLLVEQIYRSSTIIWGGSYHH